VPTKHRKRKTNGTSEPSLCRADRQPDELRVCERGDGRVTVACWRMSCQQNREKGKLTDQPNPLFAGLTVNPTSSECVRRDFYVTVALYRISFQHKREQRPRNPLTEQPNLRRADGQPDELRVRERGDGRVVAHLVSTKHRKGASQSSNGTTESLQG